MLQMRIDAHSGVSHRTGCNLNKKEFSNIREHAKIMQKSVTYDHFEIVGQAAYKASLLILESSNIKQLVL